MRESILNTGDGSYFIVALLWTGRESFRYSPFSVLFFSYRFFWDEKVIANLQPDLLEVRV